MPPELHRRVRELFDEALERPDAERLTFLESACRGDAAALQAAVRLLEAHARTTSVLDSPPPCPPQIGRYVVLGELGRGAMGIVYDAIDPLIGRNVAVKVIHSRWLANSSEAGLTQEQLFREARSAGLLSHPGIVTVFDVGQEGDLAFIAMERVEGPSLLQALTAGQKIDRAQKLDILRQTAQALDYAHGNGVVHRDVKPANIMLHNGVTVKLTDFGIAKVASTQTMTRSGIVVGTPAYMSPEQLQAQKVDGRSDQYSLAVVAFEMLTGIRPFRADSLAGMLHQAVYEDRPSARAANPSLPAAADAVFYRGLAKLPEARYGSCAEFVAALEAALEERPSPASLAETATMRSARPRRTVALQYLIPSLAITLAVRWYLDTSPVTRDRPLGLAETVVVFVAVLILVAAVRWAVRLLKLLKKVGG